MDGGNLLGDGSIAALPPGADPAAFDHSDAVDTTSGLRHAAAQMHALTKKNALVLLCREPSPLPQPSSRRRNSSLPGSFLAVHVIATAGSQDASLRSRTSPSRRWRSSASGRWSMGASATTAVQHSLLDRVDVGNCISTSSSYQLGV